MFLSRISWAVDMDLFVGWMDCPYGYLLLSSTLVGNGWCG
jgi:hypothetical protein